MKLEICSLTPNWKLQIGLGFFANERLSGSGTNWAAQGYVRVFLKCYVFLNFMEDAFGLTFSLHVVLVDMILVCLFMQGDTCLLFCTVHGT